MVWIVFAVEGNRQRRGLSWHQVLRTIGRWRCPCSNLTWFDDKGMRVLSLWDPNHPMREVDLFVENPIDFDLLYERSQIVALDTTNVRIASIEDLIHLKRLANRPEDQRDTEALQAIRRSKHDG